MIANRTSARLANKQIKREQGENSKKRSIGGKIKHSNEEDELNDIDDLILNQDIVVADDENEEIEELSSARHKLNDILANLSRAEEANDEYFEENEYGLSSAKKLQRPKGPRKSRKRLREDGFNKTSLFVVKLFDRSVDLAPFCTKAQDENVPLYPICRAWMRNQSTFYSNRRDTNEDDMSERPPGVYNLPPPEPIPFDERRWVDLRFPLLDDDLLPKRSYANFVDTLTNDEMSDILNSSLARWKRIRQKWESAAKRNESRFKHSFDVLRAMSMSYRTNVEDDMVSNN